MKNLLEGAKHSGMVPKCIRTQIVNIQTGLQWYGLDQSLYMCYNGPVIA